MVQVLNQNGTFSVMEYRDELDRSNCIFLSQLETTQEYLKERALAAFECVYFHEN